jgi:hypothetical protein
MIDDGRAETVHEDVILEGAEHAAFACVFLDDGRIHRLDETRIDEGDGESFFLQQGLGPLRHLKHRAKT